MWVLTATGRVSCAGARLLATSDLLSGMCSSSTPKESRAGVDHPRHENSVRSGAATHDCRSELELVYYRRCNSLRRWDTCRTSTTSVKLTKTKQSRTCAGFSLENYI